MPWVNGRAQAKALFSLKHGFSWTFMSVASLVLKDSLFKIIFISFSYLEDHHLKSVSMEKISLGSLVLGCCRKNMGLAKWRPFGCYFSEDLVQDFGAVTGCSHDWKKKSLPFASSPGNLRGYMRKRKECRGRRRALDWDSKDMVSPVPFCAILDKSSPLLCLHFSSGKVRIIINIRGIMGRSQYCCSSQESEIIWARR